MRFTCLLFFSFFICFNAAANAVEVAYTEQWLSLVHYQKSFFGGYKSTIDSQDFFISKNGKKSPQEELVATIELFNSNDKKKKCLFPARYSFLKAKGLIQDVGLKCTEFEQFYEDLSPSGVTILFTDAYMNNPSSLFGHTLFRIDTSRKGTQLLAHGVNYGAVTGEENGVLFAVLGLTGGYMGSFTVKPYYDVINTYNNIENRDIWEMNLDLSPEELNMFVAHLWEIGHTHTKYYFLSQNCSYMLMETLDAVKPNLQLAKDFPVHTIPSDTFKAVSYRKGLVKGLHFRPSRQSKIVYKYRQMTSEQKKVYSRIIKQNEYELEKLSEEEKAGVLDTAYQYIQYQNAEGELERDDYRSKSFKLLGLRNQVLAKDKLEDLTSGKSPLESHNSMRVSLGTGFRNGEAFQEIEYRPAYHSLTDRGYGYLKGAEINFLNGVIRHYDRQDKYVLQEFDLVGIKSLSPVSSMFLPYSYQIDAKLKREMNPKTEEEGYSFNLDLATGFTYELNNNIWLYAMVSSKGAYGGFLPHNSYVGLGGKVGALMEFGEFRTLAEVEKIEATSKFGTRTKYNIEGVYALSKNTSVALSYLYEQNYGKNISEPMLSLRYHFY